MTARSPRRILRHQSGQRARLSEFAVKFVTQPRQAQGGRQPVEPDLAYVALGQTAVEAFTIINCRQRHR